METMQMFQKSQIIISMKKFQMSKEQGQVQRRYKNHHWEPMGYAGEDLATPSIQNLSKKEMQLWTENTWDIAEAWGNDANKIFQG